MKIRRTIGPIAALIIPLLLLPLARAAEGKAGAEPAASWGVALYPGATLEARTSDGGWSVARYRSRDRASMVLDFYSGRYGEPALEGGKWSFDLASPDLELEVAEIALGPDEGQTVFYVRHRGDDAAGGKPAGTGGKAPAAGEREAVSGEGPGERIWDVPVYPGAVRRGIMEAGGKRYVTFSTTASPDEVVGFYEGKYGKATSLPPNRKLVRAVKQGVEITIAPVADGGTELTYASTRSIEE